MSRKVLFNLTLTSFSLLINFIIVPARFEELNNLFLHFIISLFFINGIFFLRTVFSITKNWINFSTLFLIGFAIVNFFIVLFSLFNIQPALSPDYIWINKKVVHFAIWLSATAFYFYMIGCMLIFLRNKRKILNKKRKVLLENFKYQNFDFLLLIMLIAFAYLVGNTFLSGRYDGGSNWGFGASYVNLLLKAGLILRILYFFHDINVKKISLLKGIKSNITFLFVLVCYMILFILAGDRGPVIELSSAVIFAYAFFYRRIGLIKLFMLITIASLFLTVLRLGRSSYEISDANVLERGIEQYSSSRDNIAIPAEELASSVRILFRAINEVPYNFDYLNGATMLFDVCSAVPFGSRFMVDTLNYPKILQSSTSFFTILGQGPFYTYGEGSQMVADVYVNFGTLGVFVMFFLLGLTIAYLQIQILSGSNFNYIVIYLAFFASAIYINRSIYFYPLQLMVYLLLMKFIFIKICKR